MRHPSETEITAAFKRMVIKSPMVAFLEGHGNEVSMVPVTGIITHSLDIRHSVILLLIKDSTI